jgi:hypothetical protein
MLRNDFEQASVGLTLPAQKRHVADLNEWLVDGSRLLDDERVVALTNFQQGRLGRMPVHILLVTTARIAFTHDGGIGSIPLADIETSGVDVSAGIVHGVITIPLRDGTKLTFRRGMSLAMAEVAGALRTLGCPSPSRVSRDSSPQHRPGRPISGPQASPRPSD